ncbi:MAG: Actin-like ATPase involved in cell division-like protein [Parcubacteria group bacterium Athens0714_26]|nr:MAG: Actin-like ATPase involved in cell division-like protein [Parcubacteria group bacterium Athens1014_26]TSD03533.1 MAG: Actin-like ATPase involved in cell division-like protein [Parcubacteria group bacterium Athens0714_26]
MWAFLRKIFFGKSDNYAVIEVLNNSVRIFLLRFYTDKKRIEFLNNSVRFFNGFDRGEILKIIKLMAGRAAKSSNLNIILTLDSQLATTIYSTISLIRTRPKELIDEADLDNLISQSIWRFFDRERLKAAQKMGVGDIDVLLGDVRVKEIKVDGHKVVNAIGFKAKSLDISLSQTFVPRDFIKGIYDIFTPGKISFITEAGASLSHFIRNAGGEKKPFLLANLFYSNSEVFRGLDERISYVSGLDWGEVNLLSRIGESLLVEEDTAKGVLDSYFKNNTSQNFLKKIENILTSELTALIQKIDKLNPMGSGAVYLNPYFNLPPLIFSPHFKPRLNGGLKLVSPAVELIVKDLGFELEFNKLADIKNSATVLVAFLEFILLPNNERLNHIVNRRVRWLTN